MLMKLRRSLGLSLHADTLHFQSHRCLLLESLTFSPSHTDFHLHVLTCVCIYFSLLFQFIRVCRHCQISEYRVWRFLNDLVRVSRITCKCAHSSGLLCEFSVDTAYTYTLHVYTIGLSRTLANIHAKYENSNIAVCTPTCTVYMHTCSK